MKLYVVRGNRRFRPTLRIDMRSGFCGGPQWVTAFDIKRGALAFGGSNCVGRATVAEQIAYYMEYLKSRGYQADWVKR